MDTTLAEKEFSESTQLDIVLTSTLRFYCTLLFSLRRNTICLDLEGKAIVV